MHFSFAGRRRALPALILALLIPLAVPFAALAQDDDQDLVPAPAGSAVARIDALNGDVAIQRGDSNDTVAAVTNAPVLGADYVTTGPNGRAEVGFDGRAAVRLGENVQIRFSKLDTGDRQMQLAAGTIELRLFGDTDGQSVIDTPSISIVPRTAGSFRVSVDNDGTTAVTVRSGRADIVTPQGTQGLAPGTTLIAAGVAANPHIQTQPAVALDGFDSYNGERDHIYEVAIANSPYVDPNIQGVGDLNANGRWVDDGTYGNVWIPATVAADWAPYRDGSWTWEDGYGWTWVAREPWGWAPYHYGRWYYSNAYRHWAWYPPARGRAIPAWSPALVGFVGFNIGAVSVGVGFGNIGWVPLAPFEPYRPWWGSRGTTIVQNTTIINNYNTTTIHYRNLQVNNALTSVTRENFQAGRFNERVAISSEQLRSGSIRTVNVQGALPIVPGRANLRFTERTVAPALAARPAFADRTFAGRPIPVTRTPFAEQQQSVSRVTHVAYRPAPQANPAAPAAVQNVRGDAAPVQQYHATPNGADPWSRFNGNRGAQTQTNTAPGYTRPAVQSGAAVPQSEYRRTTPAYTRPAEPAAQLQPHAQYQRPAQTQLQYQRPVQAQPPYQRPAQAQPQYQRPAQYERPAAPAQHAAPAARATHANEERHGDRDR
jgi:hypothetical protein